MSSAALFWFFDVSETAGMLRPAKNGALGMTGSEPIARTSKREVQTIHNLAELLRGKANLLIRHFRKERHAQNSLAGALGMREAAGFKS